MEEINRIEDLTHDKQDSQVLEPLAASEVSTHQLEATEPTTDELDPLPDLPDGDVEASHWRASVEAYVSMQTKPFTTDQVLTEGMHLFQTDDGEWRRDQMRVAEILRKLGFDRQQRRIEGVRAQYWSSPTMVAFEARAQAAPIEAPSKPLEQHADPAAADPLPFLTETPNTVIGDAADDAGGALSTPAEPAQPSEPRESASARYQRLNDRQIDIKRKLADAKRALHFAQEARRKAALEGVDGGLAAEAAYWAAVDKDKAANAHVEQLTAALSQINQDVQRASVYAEAERRVQQCNAVREDARRIEVYGPRIESLLAELGKAVSGYLHDVNAIHRKSWPVLTGAREVAVPYTEPVACALLGQFLRSSGLNPEFFLDLTSYGMNGLLRYETPSQIVDMQLGNITERLVDNNWGMVHVQETDDETEEDEHRAVVPAPGHELVPNGIYPDTNPPSEEE